MLHDEANYPEPLKFNPDRFLTQDGQLDPTVQDPALAVFGFGRRFVHLFPKIYTNLLYSSLLTKIQSHLASPESVPAIISPLHRYGSPLRLCCLRLRSRRPSIKMGC